MKKIVSLLLVLLLLLPCVSVSAESLTNGKLDTVSPRFKEMTGCNAALTPAGGGTYIFSGSARANSTVTISVTVTLQRANSSSGWDDMATLTDSGTSYASCSGQRYLSSGTYRTKTVANVYSTSGAFIESATVYSSTVTR